MSLHNYANPWVVQWGMIDGTHVTVTCEEEERSTYYIYLKSIKGYEDYFDW